MERILIIEDADSLREVLTAVMEQNSFKVDAFARGEQALEAIRGNQLYDCILSDFKLPGMNGLDVLTATREISLNVPFIIMTAYGSINIAVEAMKRGANDFITKPFEPTTLVSMIREVVEHKRIVDRSRGKATNGARPFLTADAELQSILDNVRKVARVDTSVMILGESGTGKELIARLIHDQSPRRDKPFIAVNCAAMPAELLESEFFGHEAGSFTGATQKRLGVFELASDGTIFFDEIGDMPLPLQVKLLRAIQEREIKRVGGSKVIKVDPRIVAATNKNLEEALSTGTMREDFYYRIAVVTLTIPPLRERKEDIDLLVDHYLKQFGDGSANSRLTISEEAREILRKYLWPGNARELENVIERAAVITEGRIEADHLGISLDTHFDSIAELRGTLPEITERATRKAEADAIAKILAQTMGNKTKAAQILGVSYKTLLNKVKEYNLVAR